MVKKSPKQYSCKENTKNSTNLSGLKERYRSAVGHKTETSHKFLIPSLNEEIKFKISLIDAAPT